MSNEDMKDFLYYFIFIPVFALSYGYGIAHLINLFFNVLPWPHYGV